MLKFRFDRRIIQPIILLICGVVFDVAVDAVVS